MGVFDQNEFKYNDAQPNENENGVDIFQCNNTLEDCDFKDIDGNCAFETCIISSNKLPVANPSIKVRCKYCNEIMDAKSPYFDHTCDSCLQKMRELINNG
jgi:hypothetical protein